MATIPTNWTNWNLSDWTTQYNQSGFSSVIPWNEVKTDISLNKLHLASEALSAGEMVWVTNWAIVNSIASLKTLYVSILGGFNPVTNKMVPPMVHPQCPSMYATDIDINPVYDDNTVADVQATPQTPANYRFAICRVSFQNLPYRVTTASTGQIPPWLEIRAFANNDRVNAPAGYLVYIDPPPATYPSLNNVTVPTGILFTQGMTYVSIIAHRIPSQFANNTTQLIESVIAQNGAFTNSDTFLGCPAETLLIDSIQQNPFGDFLGNQLYDVIINLLFHPNLNVSGSSGITWNQLRAPNGGIYNVRLNDGSTKQYFPVAFTSLFQFQGLLS